jgi:CO/xanthine dehydrogenase FAD-binding subunit
MTELSGIREESDHWRIGAMTTWTDILKADLPSLFDGLKQAAREIGGLQVQNAGTIGGNLCNASPAADSVPVLLSQKAKVETVKDAAVKICHLSEFILGNRRTVLQSGEILSAVLIPKAKSDKVKSSFLKLGSRRYLVISLVMVAIVIEIDGNRIIQDCRIAVGACSEVAKRLPSLEQCMIGKACGAELSGFVMEEHFAELKPLDDVRASAHYRKKTAMTLVMQALQEMGKAK